MRLLLLSAILLLLSGCDGGKDADTLNVDSKAEANRIADLAELDRNEIAAEQVRREPLPLQPVTFEDADRELASGAGCDLIRGEDYLLVAVEGDAIVQVDGRIVHVTGDGLNESGGFFRSPQVTVSIGRTSDKAVIEGETARWPAEVSVRRVGDDKPVKVEAYWRCGA